MKRCEKAGAATGAVTGRRRASRRSRNDEYEKKEAGSDTKKCLIKWSTPVMWKMWRESFHAKSLTPKIHNTEYIEYNKITITSTKKAC